MKLIDNWHKAHRFVSMRIQAAGVVVAGAWPLMPQEWKDATPKWVLIAFGAAFLIAAMGGRVVKQEPKQGGQG